MSDASTIVLVVDDNDGTRYALAHTLRRAGFTVWEAGTGAEALRRAAENPSLITLDVRLPDILGFEVCRRLKADPATASIPVLQTSASLTASSDKVQGLQGGADGYLVQPIEPDELVATVRALLRTRQAEALAQALAGQWQATFDAIGSAVCLIDAAGRVERCNAAFGGLAGLAFAQILGQPVAEIFRAAGLDDPACAEAIAQRRPEAKEIALGRRWFSVSINPIPGREGQTACVFTDVTATRHAEERLRDVNQELDLRVRDRTRELVEANAQLESFCYSVSHDLRTPLRALHGFAELILDGHAEGRQLMERIQAAAGKMDGLIQDLLVFSTLSQSALEFEPVALAEVVGHLLIAHEAEFTAKGVSCTADLPPDLAVLAHRPALRQAIWNLLANAAKFASPGRAPRIGLLAERRGGAVRLSVRDNGIGIAPEYQARIFDLFERLHPETHAGNGIGLAIVHRAVERMRGRTGVTSEPGQGSTFWIELPAA
jgi:PAS domain S-box-containing protein